MYYVLYYTQFARGTTFHLISVSMFQMSDVDVDLAVLSRKISTKLIYLKTNDERSKFLPNGNI